MKKNFKFMLVALVAFLGFNSAMAAELLGSTQYPGDGYQYKILSLNAATLKGTVSVSQSNWATQADDKTKIEIKKSITIYLKGQRGSAEIDDPVVFDVVEIEPGGFANLETVTSITFEAGSNLERIGEGAFEYTKIANLDLTNTKVKVLNKLFEDANTTLKSVTFPASLTEVKDYALQHCYTLSSIVATASTSLVTLGANCFGDNVVKELDLSKTKVKYLNSTPFVGKTGESGEKNKTLKKLVLPTTIETLGKGLANLYNMEEVNLEDTKITDVQSLAFENDKSLKSLKFPKTMQKVRYAEIFKGCASLATLTFYYDNLVQIGVNDGSHLMTEATAGDGTLSALKNLNFITSNATLYDFTAIFKQGAFDNLTGITAVSFAAGDNISTANIESRAIALSNEENSTVTMGNLQSAPAAGFIAGPTAAEVAANVTIGEVGYAQNQTAGIVSGNIGTFTVGKLTASLEVAAIGQAKTIVFSGDITAPLTQTSFIQNNRLTTINFGSVKIADVADIIPNGAFNEFSAPQLTAVNWTPVIDASNPAPTAQIFNQAAFGNSPVYAAVKVTFTTVPEVAALYPFNISDPSIEDLSLYNVKFEFAAVDDFTAIKVYGPADAVVYVGYFHAPATSNYYIEKKQGDAIITVYSAFVDESDSKIYMDPLMIVDGKFVVEAGQTVVIRSTTGDDVKAYATMDNPTMRYYWDATIGGYSIVNELQFTEVAISADELGTMYYDHGQYVYYLQNPTTATGINFQILGETQYLFKNAVYIVKAGKGAARLQVVWLDENSQTAIDAIKNKAIEATDVIYNLAGQKVDASYKGVVIKNGKKFIQK